MQIEVIRVLALMEADRIAGPAKNLLRFGTMALSPADDPAAGGGQAKPNGFLEAARERGLGAYAKDQIAILANAAEARGPWRRARNARGGKSCVSGPAS
jgi:hypothetical protein